jgi:hypothetical protein
MKIIIALLTLLSLNAFADEHYKCYNVQSGSTQEVTMKLTTGLFSKNITKVNLISEIKSGKFESIENPFTSVDASFDDLDPNAVKEASKLSFKQIKKNNSPSNSSIALSESLLSFQKTGFAYYYSYSCFWILDCFTTSDYYKCDKL